MTAGRAQARPPDSPARPVQALVPGAPGAVPNAGACGRCNGVYPLARVGYRFDGDRKTRWSKPLCLGCRVTARRLVWRRGGRVVHPCRPI